MKNCDCGRELAFRHEPMTGFCYDFAKRLLDKLIELKKEDRVFIKTEEERNTNLANLNRENKERDEKFGNKHEDFEINSFHFYLSEISKAVIHHLQNQIGIRIVQVRKKYDYEHNVNEATENDITQLITVAEEFLGICEKE